MAGAEHSLHFSTGGLTRQRVRLGGAIQLIVSLIVGFAGCGVGEVREIDLRDADRELVFLVEFDRDAPIFPSAGTGMVAGTIVFGPNIGTTQSLLAKTGLLRVPAKELLDPFGFIPFASIESARLTSAKGTQMSGPRIRTPSVPSAARIALFSVSGEEQTADLGVLGDIRLEITVEDCPTPRLSQIAEGARLLVGGRGSANLRQVVPYEDQLLLRTPKSLALVEGDRETNTDISNPRIILADELAPTFQREFVAYSPMHDADVGLLISAENGQGGFFDSFVHEVELSADSLLITRTASIPMLQISDVAVDAFGEVRVLGASGLFGAYRLGGSFQAIRQFPETSGTPIFTKVMATGEGRWVVFERAKFHVGAGSDDAGWQSIDLPFVTLNVPRIDAAARDPSNDERLWFGGHDGELYAFYPRESRLEPHGLMVPDLPCGALGGPTLGAAISSLVVAQRHVFLFAESCHHFITYNPATACSAIGSPVELGFPIEGDLRASVGNKSNVIVFDFLTRLFEVRTAP